MKTFLYILLVGIGIKASAQDPRLFENTWYLHKVILDGTDHFPPSNSEIETVDLVFVDHPNYYSMATDICSMISADVNNINNQVIDIAVFYIINGNCTLPETLAFEDLYFNGFYRWTVTDQTFDYVIESGTGNTQLLTLANQLGDTAIYGNYILALENVDAPKYSFYPNPVKNELILNSEKTTVNLKVKIFNIEGKLIGAQTIDIHGQTSIDVSGLTSGIYFLNIEDESGNTTIKKFIKE